MFEVKCVINHSIVLARYRSVFSCSCFALFCLSLVIHRLFVLNRIKFRLPHQPLHPSHHRRRHKFVDLKPITITSSITTTSRLRRPSPILVMFSRVPIRTYSIRWPRPWWCSWCSNTWWPAWWLQLAYHNYLLRLFHLQHQLRILRRLRRKPTWIVSPDSGYDQSGKKRTIHTLGQTAHKDTHSHKHQSWHLFVCLLKSMCNEICSSASSSVLASSLFCCYFVLSMTFSERLGLVFFFFFFSFVTLHWNEKIHWLCVLCESEAFFCDFLSIKTMNNSNWCLWPIGTESTPLSLICFFFDAIELSNHLLVSLRLSPLALNSHYVTGEWRNVATGTGMKQIGTQWDIYCSHRSICFQLLFSAMSREAFVHKQPRFITWHILSTDLIYDYRVKRCCS